MTKRLVDKGWPPVGLNKRERASQLELSLWERQGWTDWGLVVWTILNRLWARWEYRGPWGATLSPPPAAQMHLAQFTLHSAQCTLHSAQCTLHCKWAVNCAAKNVFEWQYSEHDKFGKPFICYQCQLQLPLKTIVHAQCIIAYVAVQNKTKKNSNVTEQMLESSAHWNSPLTVTSCPPSLDQRHDLIIVADGDFPVTRVLNMFRGNGDLITRNSMVFLVLTYW